MQNEKTIQFSGLNALRFLSALSIIVYHSTLNIQGHFPDGIKMFVHNLHIGVDMFFILSGFLIVYLLLEEKDQRGTISLYRFYVRRILRIFPLYYLIIGIAWVWWHNSHPEIAFEKYLFFAGNFNMIDTNAWTVGILNPLWSLCIEEHFYLVIPILVLLVPLRKIHLLFWSIILVSIAFRIYATLTVEYNWFTIYVHTLSRCDVLAIGGLLAYYHKTNRFQTSMPNYLVGGIFIYLLFVMSIVDNSDYTTISLAVWKKYLFILPMFLLFLGVVLNKNSTPGFLHWMKVNKSVDYLGKVSFGLYLYHSIVLDLISPIAWINDSALLKLSIALFGTILISALSYEFFEKQVLKLKSKFEVIKTRNGILDVQNKGTPYALDHPATRQPV